jgi:hypothetical protein
MTTPKTTKTSATKATSKATKATSKATKATPKATKATSKATKATPKATKATPKATKATPKVTKATKATSKVPAKVPAKKRHSRQEVDWFLHERIDTGVSSGTALTAAMKENFGFTRQAANAHLKRLVDAGALEVATKGTEREFSIVYEHEFEFAVHLEGLAEDILWNQKVAKHVQDLEQNVRSLLFYGFTEMVNNAIDHSEGRRISVAFRRSFAAISIEIKDDGVGIFKKIKEACNLAEEHHALLELSKGKLTTAQARHSGEGIFFTSRACDRFLISSGKLTLVHWGDSEADVLLTDGSSTEGTQVHLIVASGSLRTMENIFNEYTSGDGPSFSKTLVPVKLAAYQGEGLVSRSQAKRLLARFDRFEKILLDFHDVPSIGQGFADEIFRVFVNEHPNIRIVPTRTNTQVKRMILHVTGQAPPAKAL